jgi:hypothetical protein
MLACMLVYVNQPISSRVRRFLDDRGAQPLSLLGVLLGVLLGIRGSRLIIIEERENITFVPRGEALLLHATRGHPGVPWTCSGVLLRTCGWKGWHGEAGLRGGVHGGDPIQPFLHRSDACLASVEE